MIDIKKELDQNQVVLAVMDSTKYQKAIEIVPKILSSDGSTCYVTTNKTFGSLSELFKKKKVNIKNIIFIDSISKTFRNVSEQEDNVYYVSSPGALTELSLTINKFLKHEFNYLIFDSITTLMSYENQAVVQKFLMSLAEKIKGTNTKAVFLMLDLKEHEDLIKKGQMIFDKVIRCCE
ncbi:MAG: hypothetical protein WC413_02385 [Candidatus Nanoarchaeia archaeon]